MLVRVVRRFERALSIGAVGTIAVVAGALVPQALRAQEATAPTAHTVKRGDTLWDLAKLYFGDSFLWPEIYRLNVDVIEDPHWIYPGEVLKLPSLETAKVVAVSPPAAAPAAPVAAPVAPQPAAPQPTAPTPVAESPATMPAALAPVHEPEPEPYQAPTRSAVRVGEYAASPWLDVLGGPQGSGYIIQNSDVSAVASADHSRQNLFDAIMIAPPAGTQASERQLFLAYRLGPLIENFGQVVIPTGIIQVTRASQPGEAAVARVVKMFSEVLQGQRLIPYDSAGAVVSGFPSPITNGRIAQVRWIQDEPVLPSIQSYVIVDMGGAEGVRTGDQIELYQPRQGPVDGRPLAIPEISIAHAQVLRVTPYSATAMITSQQQSRIEQGTQVRVSAKMP